MLLIFEKEFVIPDVVTREPLAKVGIYLKSGHSIGREGAQYRWLQIKKPANELKTEFMGALNLS